MNTQTKSEAVKDINNPTDDELDAMLERGEIKIIKQVTITYND